MLPGVLASPYLLILLLTCLLAYCRRPRRSANDENMEEEDEPAAEAERRERLRAFVTSEQSRSSLVEQPLAPHGRRASASLRALTAANLERRNSSAMRPGGAAELQREFLPVASRYSAASDGEYQS